MNNQNNENLNFKEAKKHNKQLLKKYANDEITSEELDERRIDLYDLVSNKLTSDEGLDKKYFLLFHLDNKNGVRNSMPEWRDFTFPNADGKDIYYYGAADQWGKNDNYHIKKLLKYLGKADRVTWWDIRYHVQESWVELETYKKWRKTKEVA